MTISKTIIFLLVWLLPLAAQAGNTCWVAALISSDEQVFNEPLATFKAGMDCDVRDFALQGDIQSDADLMDRIINERPSLIFALGAKAAYLAKLWTKEHQEIPVIFAMVLNWEQYQLLEGQANIVGINSEVDPGNQFLSLSMFAPGIKRIGVIYNPRHSAALVDKAKKAVAILGMELIERQIDNSWSFRRTYRQLADQVDGLWVLNDPVTYTLDNMSWLGKGCIKDRLVCVGQGINLTEIGFMLSVRSDVGSIGSQAASMARNIIERNQTPASIGVMAPLGTHISLNHRTAKSVGVLISSQALDMAGEVIE